MEWSLFGASDGVALTSPPWSRGRRGVTWVLHLARNGSSWLPKYKPRHTEYDSTESGPVADSLFSLSFYLSCLKVRLLLCPASTTSFNLQ